MLPISGLIHGSSCYFVRPPRVIPKYRGKNNILVLYGIPSIMIIIIMIIKRHKTISKEGYLWFHEFSFRIGKRKMKFIGETI